MYQKSRYIGFWNLAANVKMTLDKNTMQLYTKEFNEDEDGYEGLQYRLFRYLRTYVYKRKGRKYKSFVFHAVALAIEK